MYPIITISGTPGSGKSTISKNLVKELKAERIYVGGIRRELAKEKGMTLSELNEYALTHPETDIDVDKQAASEARAKAKKSLVILEGRVQFHFIPESIKLYIKVDISEGAKRIWLSMQEKGIKKLRNEAKVASVLELEKTLVTRQSNDKARYKKYYNLDHTDEAHYDFVLDTTDINAQEATQKTLDFIQNKLQS